MYFLEDKKTFVVEREYTHPLDKVYPQFYDFQNYVRWNEPFYSDKKYNFRFFTPYQGKGSSVSFISSEDQAESGETFIKEIGKNQEINYHLYKKNQRFPYKIGVKFLPKNQKTKVVWTIETPEQPFMLRFMNFITNENILSEIQKSTENLAVILSGKVGKELIVSDIKYDSIMLENQPLRLFLGINVSAKNTGKDLFRNIIINHNKLANFVTKDLAKSEDEYGYPSLFTVVGGLNKKEISYFYGMPFSKKENIHNNNFVYVNIPKSDNYVVFYKGNYNQRHRAVEKLLNKAKKDSMKHGKLEELFVEQPVEGKEVVLKLSLPVSK